MCEQVGAWQRRMCATRGRGQGGDVDEGGGEAVMEEEEGGWVDGWGQEGRTFGSLVILEQTGEAITLTQARRQPSRPHLPALSISIIE